MLLVQKKGQVFELRMHANLQCLLHKLVQSCRHRTRKSANLKKSLISQPRIYPSILKGRYVCHRPTAVTVIPEKISSSGRKVFRPIVSIFQSIIAGLCYFCPVLSIKAGPTCGENIFPSPWSGSRDWKDPKYPSRVCSQ